MADIYGPKVPYEVLLKNGTRYGPPSPNSTYNLPDWLTKGAAKIPGTKKETVLQSVFKGDPKTIAQGGIDTPYKPVSSDGPGAGLGVVVIGVLVFVIIFLIKSVLSIFR